MVRGHLKGQDSMEYMAMLGIALIIALIGFSLFEFWPEYNEGIETQRSDDYWRAARPFSVKDHAMVPNQLVLQITNEEPVALTITSFSVEGQSLQIYSHPIPFSWSATPVCSGGVCSLLVRPGQTVILSTQNFTSGNPCFQSSSFQAGQAYSISIEIAYTTTSSPAVYNQNGAKPLSGTCSPST